MALLQEKKRRTATNLLKNYQPYSKQREFHEAGASFRERLFKAGNQLGKCRTFFDTIVHPDGTESYIGELFERGLPFEVQAWDGTRLVAARASHVVKKPAEMCAEVFLSNGKSFKASLHHVLLTNAGWTTLECLLPFASILPESNSECAQSTHVEGEGNWIEKALDWTDHYCQDQHRYDALPLLAGVGDQSHPKRPCGVLPHNRVALPSGFQGQKHTNNGQPLSARPSSWYGGLLNAARSAVSLARAAYRRAQPQKGNSQVWQRLGAVSVSLLRSFVAVSPGQWSKNVRALVSPSGQDVEIVAYRLIGVHDLYDLTVPFHHNYVADGVVHHNTLAGAAEAAMHMTGRYPDWWTGHRFDRPITMIAGSESYELTRDGVQRLLIGPPAQESDWGTGYIPADAIVSRTRRMGVSNALDSVTVAHVSGGQSTLLFKAYEQGRGKWQANTVDYVWFDEEPPEDVYFEGITRTNATKGLVAVTFTPLNGMSAVVSRFLMEDSPDRAVITMTIDDAEHYSAEERAKIIASYPAHERDARTRGIPTFGSGLVYPVIEDEIVVEPFDIPKHWPQIGGLDFGWDHPFAAIRLVWNRDDDIVFLVAEYRQRESTPLIHAGALKPWGEWLPFAWPHDGLQHDKGSGDQLAEQYRAQGLNMLPERATFEDGTNGREAGISEILTRMQTGRFKVFRTCSNWLEERRLYHRKNGIIVRERDDTLDATRYGVMMLRYAEESPRSVDRYRRAASGRSGSWMAD